MNDLNKISEIEKLINQLFNCFEISTSSHINPDFLKCFTKTVSTNYIKQGLQIPSTYFHNYLPNLLSTSYAGFWFYSVDTILNSNISGDTKVKILEKLNSLYVFIFFNSLIKKFIPHNFDENLWLEAVNKSKSKYLKSGLEYTSQELGKSVSMKILQKAGNLLGNRKNYALLLIKVYYELRHRTSQIMKPIVVIYYRLRTIKSSIIGAKDNVLTHSTTPVNLERFLSWYNTFIEMYFKNYKGKFIDKLRKSGCTSSTFIDTIVNNLRVLNLEHLEYILKNLLRGVWDKEFWISDDIIKSIMYSTLQQKEITEEKVMCFLKAIFTIYTIFLENKVHIFEQQINQLLELIEI